MGDVDQDQPIGPRGAHIAYGVLGGVYWEDEQGRTIRPVAQAEIDEMWRRHRRDNAGNSTEEGQSPRP